MEHFIVASQKRWGWNLYKKAYTLPGGIWYFADHLSGIERLLDTKVNPKYIFFAHWSDKVPDKIVNNYQCVCFHPTALPDGRGGTPIQNMIKEGKTSTVVTAFRMTERMDAGPIYAVSEELTLDGSAEDIYMRMMDRCYELIKTIAFSDITPVEQAEIYPRYFKRRQPEQSVIDFELSEEELFNHIRMLDAESYPLAYIDMGDYRIKFKNVSRRYWGLEAQVTIERVVK